MSETELHCAVRKIIGDNLSYQTALNMIQSGADASVQNHNGLTPAELALFLQPEGRLATAMIIQECDALQPVDALKRIITRGNLVLFEALLEHIKKQLGPEVMLANLEQVFAELTARKVLLSADITSRIHYLLVQADYQRQLIDDGRASDTDPQVLHLVECIEFLEVNYRNSGKFNDMDDRFVLYLRQILEHVFFLKNQFKQLPLIQLQFCLAMFLKVVTEGSNENVNIYGFMLDKEIVIDFLITLKRVLRSINTNQELSAEVYFTCLTGGRSSQHKLRRNIIADIRQKFRNSKKLQQISQACTFSELSSNEIVYLNKCCHEILSHRKRLKIRRLFRSLLRTHRTAKSLYSIRRMIGTIETVSYIDLEEGTPKVEIAIAALKRALQIIGETIKSSSQTPNVTRKLDRILRRFSIQPFVDLSKDLRQHFSHGYSLGRRHMEQNIQLGTFKTIRDNLILSKHFLEYTLSLQTISVLKHFLVRLRHLASIDRMRSYIEFIGTNFRTRLRLNYEPRPLNEALLILNRLISACTDEQEDHKLRHAHKLLKINTDNIKNDISAVNVVLEKYFFLGMYILQPAAKANRVRTIVNCMLRECYRSNRFQAAYKSSLKAVADIIHKLRMETENVYKKAILNALWQRLTIDNIEGFQLFRQLLVDQEDLKLEETTSVLAQLGLTQSTSVIQMSSRRLSNKYYQNLYDLNNKYHVLHEVVKDRRVKGTTKEHQLKLKQMRSTDERLFQQKFDEKKDSIERILERYGDPQSIVPLQLTPIDRFALEYYLLEATEVLCSLKVFQDNLTSLKRIAPVITGRNLRNYLAHDPLAYDVLIGSSTTIESNAIYLLKHKIQLYRSNVRSPAGSSTIYKFADKMNLKAVWITALRSVNKHEKKPDVPRIIGVVSDVGVLEALCIELPFYSNQLYVCDTYKQNTLIHWAVLCGDLQLVATILARHETLLNETNSFGETALALAVRFGYPDIVQYLLQHGADVHLGSWSPVYIAACLGDLAIIQLLGAKPPSSSNPLVGAVQHDHFEVFVYLHRELGYQLGDDNMLQKAVQLGRTRFVSYIVESSEGRQLINSVGFIGFDSLMTAATSGHLEVFRVLMKNGADPYAITEFGYTTLHCAVNGRNRKIIDLLLQLPNMDMNAITKDDATPLRIAIGYGHLGLVQYLLNKGAKPTIEDVIFAGFYKHFNILPMLLDQDNSFLNAARDSLSMNFLIYAVMDDKETMVESFISRGIELNVQAHGGFTALHIATRHNNTAICKLLIGAGCDLNIVTDDHRTALVIALEKKYIRLAMLLLNRGADSGSARNFRYRQHRNASLLHKFALENRTFMVRFLLEELNLDKNVADDDGKTALDYAAERGNEAIVRLLE